MLVPEVDLPHLRRAVGLARLALSAGHGPFGAVLVGADNQVLREDHNRVTDADRTLHAETNVIRWVVTNVAVQQRPRTTLYTSCEHCPMCAGAHAWAGLGRVVYATSNAQLTGWLRSWGAPEPPVAMLPVATVAPGIVADGPAAELEDEMRALYEARYRP